jgi:hypothetical protein
VSDSPLYFTGHTPDGVPLVGGVWTLWAQEGFPLEMSYLVSRGNGWAVDWLEAMADASRSDDLPALIGHIEPFLARDVVQRFKAALSAVLASGKSFADILAEKRANAVPCRT